MSTHFLPGMMAVLGELGEGALFVLDFVSRRLETFVNVGDFVADSADEVIVDLGFMAEVESAVE